MQRSFPDPDRFGKAVPTEIACPGVTKMPNPDRQQQTKVAPTLHGLSVTYRTTGSIKPDPRSCLYRCCDRPLDRDDRRHARTGSEEASVSGRVGPGRPPAASRFPKGKSGNPKGRPKSG